MAELTLWGYRYRVCTRVIRMMLAEKGAVADYRETDPFAELPSAALLGLDPFHRVPVLQHGD